MSKHARHRAETINHGTVAVRRVAAAGAGSVLMLGVAAPAMATTQSPPSSGTTVTQTGGTGGTGGNGGSGGTAVSVLGGNNIGVLSGRQTTSGGNAVSSGGDGGSGGSGGSNGAITTSTGRGATVSQTGGTGGTGGNGGDGGTAVSVLGGNNVGIGNSGSQTSSGGNAASLGGNGGNGGDGGSNVAITKVSSSHPTYYDTKAHCWKKWDKKKNCYVKA